MNDNLPDLSRRGFVGALPLLSALPSWLGAQPARAAAPPPRWDFSLPTLEGDRFVRLSALRGPVLVNFWGRDCPACVSELPRLQAFAREQGDWTLLLVATDAPQEARAFLEKQGIALQALKSGPDVAPLMRRAGNHTGGLPFTVVLRDGRILGSHEGELSERTLERLRAAVKENV